jgi:YEATS domain-containing protein 1/3
MEEDMFPVNSKVPWSPRGAVSAQKKKKEGSVASKRRRSSSSSSSSSSESSSSSSSSSESEDEQPARYVPRKVHAARIAEKNPPELQPVFPPKAPASPKPPTPAVPLEKEEERPENDQVKAPNGETFRTLLDLQNKLQSLRERNFLLRVMGIIQETGLYKINNNSFDFDLCCLDAGTVHRIKEYMDTVKT